VAPLAGQIDRFIAIEPVEEYWRQEIGGTPAQYLRPTASGDLPIASGSVDLCVAFDVLHHIANVSHVIGELARVLRPGGVLIVRDPISWMGDWRRPRRGLTAYERGLPPPWFERAARERGLRVVRRRLCLFAPLSMALRRIGLAQPLDHRPVVVIDWLVSELFRWNIRYRRQGLRWKFAPSSALWKLDKPIR
jgi:SAM-dependent methyltransferase